MGDEIRKEAVSVDELLFASSDGRGFLKRDGSRDQKYCLLLNHTETIRDAENMYWGFCSVSFLKTGDPNPKRVDVSNPNTKGLIKLIDSYIKQRKLKRLLIFHTEQKKFLLMNAPNGLNVRGLGISDHVYDLDMRRYKLVYKSNKTTYRAHQQAVSKLHSLSQ